MNNQLPTKQDFIDRKVSEPLAVRLAGEYDVWDKRDPRTDTFQYALRTALLQPPDWDMLLRADKDGDDAVTELLVGGQFCERYAKLENASLVDSRSFQIQWEGLTWLCLNTARCNSLTFAAKDVPHTGHDALLAFFFNGKCWTVSLYHARHRDDLDLSGIATAYGGGGHRGACGFTCKTLPFLKYAC